MVRIEFSYTPADLREFKKVEKGIAPQEHPRGFSVPGWAFFLGLVAFFGFLNWLNSGRPRPVQPPPESAWAVVPWLIVAVFMWVYFFWQRRKWKKQRGPFTYEFDESEIRIRSAVENSDLKWRSFSCFAESQNLILLKNANERSFNVIPKRTLSPDTSSELHKILDANLPRCEND